MQYQPPKGAWQIHHPGIPEELSQVFPHRGRLRGFRSPKIGDQHPNFAGTAMNVAWLRIVHVDFNLRPRKRRILLLRGDREYVREVTRNDVCPSHTTTGKRWIAAYRPSSVAAWLNPIPPPISAIDPAAFGLGMGLRMPADTNYRVGAIRSI